MMRKGMTYRVVFNDGSGATLTYVGDVQFATIRWLQFTNEDDKKVTVNPASISLFKEAAKNVF